MAIGRPWLGMFVGLFFSCKADFDQLKKHAEDLEAKLQAKYAQYCSSPSSLVNCTDLQVQKDAATRVKNIGSGSGQAYWTSVVEALQTVPLNPGEDPHDWLPDQLSSALSTQEMQVIANMSSNMALSDDYFWGDIRGESSGSRRLGSSWNGAQVAAGKPWTNRTMVYAYHPELSWFTKRVMESAMAEITQKSCVKFRKVAWDSTEQKVHVIDNQEGCWSHVGQTNFRQELNLAVMCRFHSTALHEILHSLGQTHEQMRPDRDHFLDVKMENVEAGKAHNFDKNPRAYTGRPYDYRSVMHYSRFAFSKTPIFGDPIAAWVAIQASKWDISIGDKATLVARNTGFAGDLGNSMMSNNDVEQLQDMYQCDKLTVSSDGSPGFGVRLSSSTGVSLNTGSESAAAVCNSGYAVTSCSCFHPDGKCRGATLTDVTGGSCTAAGTTGAGSGLKAHAICHRLKSPHYGSARMSLEGSGTASQTCSRDYLLVGCSCYSSGNDPCSAKPDTSVSPGTCRVSSSGKVTAQAICLRSQAVASVSHQTGPASDVSKASCPANTELAGCSCSATGSNECKGARPAGSGSNQCWAYAKTSSQVVEAHALCITPTSAPGLHTSEFLVAGGLYTTATTASSAPVQSLYCGKTASVLGLAKMGCSSLMVQTRTQTWYNCGTSCNVLDLNVMATGHKDVTVSKDGDARCPAGWMVVNIVCVDSCKSLKLTCAPPTIDSPWFLSGTRTYSPWFNGNEGSAMATCGQSLVIGAECASSSLLRDTSCYYVRLVCRRLGIAIGDDAVRHSMFDIGFAEYAWSDYVSSTGFREAATQWQFTESLENGINNPRFGPASSVQCRGSSCDELRFQLPRLIGDYGNYQTLGGTPTIWTKEFREGTMECPMGHFVAGMRCHESYCNTKELLCATPNSTQWMVAGEQFYSYCFTNKASMSWSNWFRDKAHSFMGRAKTCTGTSPSDMPESQSCGQDGLVVGFKCFGSDCDRLQLVCRSVWVNIDEATGQLGDVMAELQRLRELQLYEDMSTWISKPKDGKVSSSRWNGEKPEGGTEGMTQDVNAAIRLAKPVAVCFVALVTLIIS
eukprot:TRINITY_DN5961_c0_g1_i4.p1 TRINITY_DN5961_c0_g1~~TRINITY_DN5961_c0_g1_i4.p1  ORF type:complete len:1097 (-),score=146.27 TRINITY_DN5961_c0_g1_i4:379-3603(-)